MKEKNIVMGIRPEDLHGKGIVADTYPTAHFKYEVEVVELLGHEFILHGKFGTQDIKAKVPARVEAKAHETLELAMEFKVKLHFFDPESEKKNRFNQKKANAIALVQVFGTKTIYF